jgi:fructose/tagatose bisphosphate aldolase
MPLKPVIDLVRDARAREYALGYFESWNLESLQGVLDAAEQTDSPIILGFNGDFMSGPDRRLPERLGC